MVEINTKEYAVDVPEGFVPSSKVPRPPDLENEGRADSLDTGTKQFGSEIVEEDGKFFVELTDGRAFPAGQSRVGVPTGEATEGFTTRTEAIDNRVLAEAIQRRIEGADREFATEIPEGFFKQTDDIFQGVREAGAKAEAIQQAPPERLFDKFQGLVRDFLKNPEKEALRQDLVVTLAKRNRLPVEVVDRNLESILANPRLSGAVKRPDEDTRRQIAFTQATVEALSFGRFTPEEAIQQEFPLESGLGTVSGAVATFLLTRKVLNKAGLTPFSERIGQSAQVVFHAAPRFIPPAIRTGSVFATVGGIRKAVEAVESKDINILNVGTEIMVSFAEGAGLGIATATLGFRRRVFTAAGLGYTSAIVRGHSQAEALVMGAVWGTLEVFGGAGKKDVALRQMAYSDLRNKLAQYARKADPNMTLQQSVFRANEYLNTLFRSLQIQAGRVISPKEFFEKIDIRGLEKGAQVVLNAIRQFKGVKGVDVLGMTTKEILQKAKKAGQNLVPKVVTKGAKTGKYTGAQVKAVQEAANIVSNFEPSQTIRDADGNITRIAGGFPEPLGNKGYTTKQINTVVKKVEEGKPLTENQEALFEDLLVLHEQAFGVFASVEPTPETPSDFTPKEFFKVTVKLPEGKTKTFFADKRTVGKKGLVSYNAVSKDGTPLDNLIVTDPADIISEKPARMSKKTGDITTKFPKPGLAAVEPGTPGEPAVFLKPIQEGFGGQAKTGRRRLFTQPIVVNGKTIPVRVVEKAGRKGNPDTYSASITSPEGRIVELTEGFVSFDDMRSAVFRAFEKAAAKPLEARPEPTTQGPLPPGEVAVPILNENQLKRQKKKELIKEKQKQLGDLPDVKEAAHELIRAHTAEVALGMLEVNKLTNDIRQQLTPEEEMFATFLIEKKAITGEDREIIDDLMAKQFGVEDFTAKLEANAERLQPIANQLSDVLKERWDFIVKNTDKLTGQGLENYITHVWEVPKQSQHFGKDNGASAVSNWFLLHNRFLKKRTIPTFIEGIKQGFIPKTLRVSELLEIHGNVMVKTTANQALVKVLKQIKVDGVPLIEKATAAPIEWQYMDIPALNKLVVIPGKAERIDKISDDLIIIMNQMGLAIGRRLSDNPFGKPSRTLGVFRPGKRPPEIALRKFFTTHTLAHELGHFLDSKLHLGEAFVNMFKTELYALNRARIQRFKGQPGPYNEKYAESVEEQIAELFAFLFADIKTALKHAPNATNHVLEMLRKDGVLRQLVDLDFETNAKIALERQLDTIREVGIRVHPDLVPALNVIFGDRFVMPDSIIKIPLTGKEVSVNWLGGYEMLNATLKKLQLSISLFHHFALSETSIANIGIKKTSSILFGVQDGIPFKKVVQAIANGEYDAFKNLELSRDAIEHGVQIGATADIPVKKIQQALNDFAKKTKNKALIGQIADFVASFNEVWDLALWNYLHDSLKLYGYEHFVSTQLDPTKDITKQKQQFAQWVNDSYGGQNWANLMITPKAVQILGWGLLSPDWTWSTMRQALAVTGIGAIHDETKGLTKKTSRHFWLRAFLYFGIGMNLFNVNNRRRDKAKHPEKYKDASLMDMTMLGNAIGHKSHLFMGRWQDGSERYLRWGKQFRELPEMLIDEMAFNPLEGFRRKIGAKAAPVPQLIATVFTGTTLSGFEIRSIKEAEGWDRTFQVMKQVLKTPLPLGTRNIIEEGKEFRITDFFMPSSKGMTRAKAHRLYKIGLRRGDVNILKQVAQAAIMNELPAAELLKAAATSLKAENTTELNRHVRTIEQVDKELAQETDLEQRARLMKLKQRLMRGKKEAEVLQDNTEIIEQVIRAMQFEFGIE